MLDSCVPLGGMLVRSGDRGRKSSCLMLGLRGGWGVRKACAECRRSGCGQVCGNHGVLLEADGGGVCKKGAKGGKRSMMRWRHNHGPRSERSHPCPSSVQGSTEMKSRATEGRKKRGERRWRMWRPCSLTPPFSPVKPAPVREGRQLRQPTYHTHQPARQHDCSLITLSVFLFRCPHPFLELSIRQ